MCSSGHRQLDFFYLCCWFKKKVLNCKYNHHLLCPTLGQPDHVTYQLTHRRHSICFDIDIEEEEVTIVLGILTKWKNGIGTSLLISMPFPLAESWLVNSNFSRANRMQDSLEFLGASPVFITLRNLIRMFSSLVLFALEKLESISERFYFACTLRKVTNVNDRQHFRPLFWAGVNLENHKAGFIPTCPASISAPVLNMIKLKEKQDVYAYEVL